MLKMRPAVHVAIVVVFALAPALALAAGIPDQIVPKNCSGPNAASLCTVCDIATLAQDILNFGIFLSVVVSAFLFAYAGILYMANEGGSQIKKAKEIFRNVAVGLIIVLAAWLLIDTIMYTFTGSHTWSQLC